MIEVDESKLNSHQEWLDEYARLGLPHQTLKERDLIKSKLLEHSKNSDLLKVFEYGTGYSSIYYPKFLDGKKVKYVWDTVDNDKFWHSKMKSANKSTNFNLFEFEPAIKNGTIAPPSKKEELDYIQCPSKSPYKYDVIFIDGRFRRRCLEAAKDCLKDGGIVILHDAHRVHYHDGLKHYKGDFIDSGIFYNMQGYGFKIYVGERGV